jgi:hypothetical protein
MPVFGYFCWVGAVLLALLFAVDVQPPRLGIAAKPFRANIRITSQVKGPEALVFSGPTIDHGVKPALEIADLSARATDPISQSRAEIRPDELPQAKPAWAGRVPQRTRKRYARRAPPARLTYQQLDQWTRSSFGEVGGLHWSPLYSSRLARGELRPSR